MKSYTLSWYTKRTGEWIRRQIQFDADHQITFEQAAAMIEAVSSSGEQAEMIQLEEGHPAIPYEPATTHRKNTNAWKPRRYWK